MHSCYIYENDYLSQKSRLSGLGADVQFSCMFYSSFISFRKSSVHPKPVIETTFLRHLDAFSRVRGFASSNFCPLSFLLSNLFLAHEVVFSACLSSLFFIYLNSAIFASLLSTVVPYISAFLLSILGVMHPDLLSRYTMHDQQGYVVA